jgi:hypothetical protein
LLFCRQSCPFIENVGHSSAWSAGKSHRGAAQLTDRAAFTPLTAVAARLGRAHVGRSRPRTELRKANFPRASRELSTSCSTRPLDIRTRSRGQGCVLTVMRYSVYTNPSLDKPRAPGYSFAPRLDRRISVDRFISPSAQCALPRTISTKRHRRRVKAAALPDPNNPVTA